MKATRDSLREHWVDMVLTGLLYFCALVSLGFVLLGVALLIAAVSNG